MILPSELDKWGAETFGQFAFTARDLSDRTERVSAIEIVGPDLLCFIRIFERGDMDVLATRKETKDVILLKHYSFSSDDDAFERLAEIAAQLRKA